MKMVNNSGAKTHLNVVNTTLDSVVSHTNIDAITTLLSKKTLDLYNNLADGHLFIDQEVLDGLNDVINKLDPASPLVQTADHYTKSKKADGKNLENSGESAGILAPGGIVTKRKGEYEKLKEYAEYFDLKKSLNNISTTFFHTPPTLTERIDLNDSFKKVSGNPDPSYELCDANGKKLKKIGSDHLITISGSDYTASDYEVEVDGKKYVLKNIIEYKDTGAMPHQDLFYFGAMEVEPSLVTGTIDLSVNAVYDSSKVGVNNVNVTCNKAFKLTLNDGVHTFDDVERENVFDASKNKAEIAKIKNKLKTLYAEQRSDIEKKFLEVYLAGNALYTAMNENEKNEFYNYLIKNKKFHKIYNDLSILKDSEKFAEFKKWFVSDDRKWNKDIKSNEEYLKTISDNIGSFKDFISENLDKYITDNAASLTFVSVCLSKYASIRQKQEVKAAKNIKGDVISSAKSDTMEKWGLFHRGDTNYMRFFSDTSTSIDNQKVKLDKDQEVTYNMSMAISGDRKITADFMMDGDKLSVSGGEPSVLARKIMRGNSVESGIVRAHMCFNVYKAMVKMAKGRDISLKCRDGGKDVSIDLESDNIVIKRGKAGEVIFDQRNFIVGSGDAAVVGPLELREGVELLGKYFNLAMNDVHKEYHKAVEGSMLKTKLPTSFRNSPIKKILNGKNIRDVTFDTTVAGASIHFEKNKFTVNVDGLEKPIVSKNLGKILRYREKGKRIFDGKERDIVQGVYVALIEELRKNPKIKDFEFGVFDDLTSDLYILDAAGKYWKIASKDVPSFKSKILTGMKFGTIKESGMYRKTALTPDEEKTVKKNPYLMQKFVRAMNRRFGLLETLRAS